MKMILLGTGTSHGVPVIGCDCAVCKSSDLKDNRLRCSAYIEEPAKLLIDVGPEFRIQALKFAIKAVDAVFITHSHADHLHGIDDLRIFSHTKALDPSNPQNKETEGDGLAIYTTDTSEKDIRHRFDYIFTPFKEGGGKPKIQIKGCSNITPKEPLIYKGVECIPVMLKHGTLDDAGWLFSQTINGKKHSIAYLTDCSYISDESIKLVNENAGCLDHLVIDGLRPKPHSTHFSFRQALEAAEKMKPLHTWITHITHNMSHCQIKEYLKDAVKDFPALSAIVTSGGSVEPAYDGLILEIK